MAQPNNNKENLHHQQQKRYHETETREAIISPKDGKPTFRIARYLKPFAHFDNQVGNIPETPLLVDIFGTKKHNFEKWPFKVHFSGWYKPIEGWENWYERLVYNHASTWIEAGIVDGILASLHEVPINRDIIYAVVEYWCPKTNTFVFPWGEATITLEDVMILGGLPVVGENFDEKCDDGKCEKIVKRLKKARKEIKKGGKKASNSDWMKYFMEEEEEGEIDHHEGKLEHVAFLSLWLSRYVLPGFDHGVVKKHVFEIAAHLSMGKPIALAPVVLANLYHELTLLTKNVADVKWGSKVDACGLFHIVQLWACERFSKFCEHLTNPLDEGDPRVVRWENVNIEVSLSEMRFRLKMGLDFLWRPYACDLQNWDHLPFYKEKEQIVDKCSVLDDCSLSFARFLHSCELIGTDCKEIYQPHRVAIQFGYDQEVPKKFKALDTSWDEVGFYVPPREFEAGVSRKYYSWWKDSISRREEAILNVLGERTDEGGDKRFFDDQSRERPDKGGGTRIVDDQSRKSLLLGDREHNRSSDFPRNVLKHLTCEVDNRFLNAEISSPPVMVEQQEKNHLPASSSKTKGTICPSPSKLTEVENLSFTSQHQSRKKPDKGGEKRIVDDQSRERLLLDDREPNRSSDFPRNVLKLPTCEVDNRLVNVDISSPPVMVEKQQKSHLTASSSKTEGTIYPSPSKLTEVENHSFTSQHPPSAVKKLASKNSSDENDFSDGVDNVPLALRVRSNVEIKRPMKSSCAGKDRICQDSDKQKIKAMTAKRTPLDPLDIDHVPLALRLRSMARVKNSPCSQSESIGSYGKERTSPQAQNSNAKTEELNFSTSDANSEVTMRMSEVDGAPRATKDRLAARVSKLEKSVAALEAANSSH